MVYITGHVGRPDAWLISVDFEKEERGPQPSLVKDRRRVSCDRAVRLGLTRRPDRR